MNGTQVIGGGSLGNPRPDWHITVPKTLFGPTPICRAEEVAGGGGKSDRHQRRPSYWGPTVRITLPPPKSLSLRVNFAMAGAKRPFATHAGRLFRQHIGVDVVIAKRRRVLLQPQTPQPRFDVHRSPRPTVRCSASRRANPATRAGDPRKTCRALPVAALNEPVFARIDGERRKITKRQAVIHQLVNKSAGADLRATKMLIDMTKDIGKKAGAAPPPEPPPLIEADEEAIKFTLRRIRSAMPQEIQDQNAGNPALAMISFPLP
jgi:hypothetical protein